MHPPYNLPAYVPTCQLILNSKGEILKANSNAHFFLKLTHNFQKKSLRKILLSLNESWDLILPPHLATESNEYFLPFDQTSNRSSGLLINTLTTKEYAYVTLASSSPPFQALADKTWKTTLKKLDKRLSHDFNNLITGIYSLSEHYASSAQHAIPLSEGMQNIKENSILLRNLFNKIIELHNPSHNTVQYLNLEHFIQTQLDLIKAFFSKKNPVAFAFNNHEIIVSLDPAEFTKTLLNIATVLSDETSTGSPLSIKIHTLSSHDSAQLSFHFRSLNTQHSILTPAFNKQFVPSESYPHSTLCFYFAQKFLEKQGGSLSPLQYSESDSFLTMTLPIFSKEHLCVH